MGEKFNVESLEEGKQLLKLKLKDWCNDDDTIVFYDGYVGKKFNILCTACVCEGSEGVDFDATGCVRERIV